MSYFLSNDLRPLLFQGPTLFYISLYSYFIHIFDYIVTIFTLTCSNYLDQLSFILLAMFVTPKFSLMYLFLILSKLVTSHIYLRILVPSTHIFISFFLLFSAWYKDPHIIATIQGRTTYQKNGKIPCWLRSLFFYIENMVLNHTMCLVISQLNVVPKINIIWN